jgi:hypothetical protein
VLFENSIVCLVVLFLLFFCHALIPRVGVWLFVLSGCFSLNGFCLESLILAQDERWRRA